MKCPNCKKDLTADFLAVKRLGYLDGYQAGENQLNTTINCIKITNRRLFNELLRLDKNKPFDDCCIKITREYAEVLIKYCGKHSGNYHVKKLRNMIKTQIITEITLD